MCVCRFSFQSIDPSQQFTWEHSNLEVNKPKNRYANVIAYDHTRVVLAPIDGKRIGCIKLAGRGGGGGGHDSAACEENSGEGGVAAA